jgi:hypothetical protein
MNAPAKILTPTDAREWAEEQFHDWVREGIRGRSQFAHNPREDTDFEDFLAAMSQPHIRDCERFQMARLSDDELVGLSRVQNMMGRGL